MKIKVKRYKEIEHMAIVEAAQRVLGEAVNADQVKAIVSALKNTGLPEAVIEGVETALHTAALANGATAESLGVEFVKT